MGSPSDSNQMRKINKRDPDWKEKVKLAYDTIHSNPKDPPKNYQNSPMNSEKVAGSEINMRNLSHSHKLTKSKLSEREIKKKNIIYICMKKNEYLGIHANKR